MRPRADRDITTIPDLRTHCVLHSHSAFDVTPPTNARARVVAPGCRRGTAPSSLHNLATAHRCLQTLLRLVTRWCCGLADRAATGGRGSLSVGVHPRPEPRTVVRRRCHRARATWEVFEWAGRGPHRHSPRSIACTASPLSWARGAAALRSPLKRSAVANEPVAATSTSLNCTPLVRMAATCNNGECERLAGCPAHPTTGGCVAGGRTLGSLLERPSNSWRARTWPCAGRAVDGLSQSAVARGPPKH